MGIQALTSSTREDKVLEIRKREFLLFPDCSGESCVDYGHQIGGRIGSDVDYIFRSFEAQSDAGNRIRLLPIESAPGQCYSRH